MCNQGLIEEFSLLEGDKRTKRAYHLTEKGDNVLKYFNRARDLMEIEKPQIVKSNQY